MKICVQLDSLHQSFFLEEKEVPTHGIVWQNNVVHLQYQKNWLFLDCFLFFHLNLLECNYDSKHYYKTLSTLLECCLFYHQKYELVLDIITTTMNYLTNHTITNDLKSQLFELIEFILLHFVPFISDAALDQFFTMIALYLRYFPQDFEPMTSRNPILFVPLYLMATL